MSALQRAIEIAGGQVALAKRVGGSLKQGHISTWLTREGARVPERRCPAIERATGVRCEELRPDVEWIRGPNGLISGYRISLQEAQTPFALYLLERDGFLSKESPGAELSRLAQAVDSTIYYLYMLALDHKQFSPMLAAKVERATARALSRKVLCPSFPWDGLPDDEAPTGIRTLIAMAGGAAAVGRACGVSSQAVSQWTELTPERAWLIELSPECSAKCEELLPEVEFTRDSTGSVTSYRVRLNVERQVA